MQLTRRTLASLLVAAAAGGSIFALRAPTEESNSSSVQTLQPSAPWQLGRCYRVFPSERDQLYVFRVIESPSGPWIRVEEDPKAPSIPGARPQAPLWVNADSVFAVQEWSCSR